MTDPAPAPINHTLLQLQQLRRELQAVLKGQRSERERFARLYKDQTEVLDRVDGLGREIRDLAREVRDIRGDMYTLDQQGLDRHTQMLEGQARLQKSLDRIEARLPNGSGEDV